MAVLSDISVGDADESTYGTSVTVTRFQEPVAGSLKVAYNKMVKQGLGLRVGSTVARAARRVVPASEGTVEYDLEALSKGQGLLWKRLMGTSASTNVSGATYQQLFKLGTSSDVVPIFTTQTAAVQAGGTVDTYTAKGCVIATWELTAALGEIVQIKPKIDARTIATAVSYATPSYVTTPSLFHWGQASLTLGTGMTVTAPTTTALGSLASGTAITTPVVDFSLQVDLKRNLARRTFGNAGLKSLPTLGMPEVKGSITIEYTDQTQVTAFLADTTAQLLLTFDTGVALSTGDETLQILLPAIKFEGDLPDPAGELTQVTVPFTAFDDLTNAPLYVVLRTADTAL